MDKPLVLISRRMVVVGRVQGVYYRQSTKEQALILGITGSVRNCPDGSVEIIATGTEEQLELFLQWCRKGPPRSRVDKIDLHEHPLKNYPGFVITY